VIAGEPGAMQFLEYADSLFMLRNFDGARMRRELLSMPLTDQDTRLFAAGLRNKSVLMIVGRDDTVTPADSMFDPTVAVYARDPAIDLRHFTISGDHSFSWSRLQLTELVLGWLDSDCR